MPRKGYWERARELDREFNRKLEALDMGLLNAVTGEYTKLKGSLEGLIKELSEVRDVTPDQIRRLGIYKRYLAALDERTQAFNLRTVEMVSAAQSVYVQLGLDFTQATISLINVDFQKLNLRALDWMIGNSIQGGRLYDLLARDYPTTVGKITQTLIESVALGRNPRDTARLIEGDMAGNLSRALRIARTETIMAYREASRQQMATSGLVKEWERIEQSDACAKCQAANGKRYPLETPFETHPNCRGTMIPVL